ncbi:TonB-dependent receptor [Campylobacter sp. MIT 12-8780]|uniref:TonB-dependent receptor domain-containing protein n=1 Tax=unclassified Campylobacter TaxID=2593542 RepID=UPI00115C6FA2|nr:MULTISPECIES: TonB-dependent receptor [unclassified Campylobacter]NDJ26921.1 TonB-dependent receptor [Campylobacter sp. MIT 19-121]TQR42032.1 TonB-dependent receptor [Campylobacter sp. MIT 12-8780]
MACFACMQLLAQEGGGALQEETLEFDTLEVSGTGVKNDEKVFVTPGAVSSREGIGSNTQSIDSIVRSVPGAYTNTDQAQGTLQVNIRGMTGFGRVNTMIDGVTQTFYGSVSDDPAGFHTQTGTSAFGAVVDTNFLISADIERGSFSGGHGGLMGSANFKTIGVNDLVREGNVFGLLGRFSYGSNGIGPSYMGSVAGKSELESGGYIGVLFGYSGKRITQNYTVGGGGKIGDTMVDTDGDGIADTSTAPFDPDFLTQKPNSQLFKLEYAPNSFTNAIFSYRRYQNELAGRKINNDNYQLDFWHNPTWWLNLNALFAYNQGIQTYGSNSTFGANIAIANTKAKNKATTFDISDTLESEFGGFKLNTRFGTNVLLNDYKNTINISANTGTSSLPFQPRGKQNLLTYYLDNSLNYGIFTLGTNVNLLDWNIKGHRPACDEVNFMCFPKTATDIDKDGLRFNASVMLSATFHELFTPFVSFARTNRAPNVQEMFFSNNEGNGVNPFLKPEQANTWQIGFNSFKHGLLKDDDRFGFKAVYYHTKIKDYIYNDQFYLENADGSQSSQFYMHLNSVDDTIFKGVELELSYDFGFVYTKAMYSRQETSSAISQTSGPQFGSFSASKIMELPKDYANIELGVRLSDRISFGGIAKYTGKAKRVNPNTDAWTEDPNNPYYPDPSTQDLPRIPTIVDLYWNIEWLKNFTMRAEVQNAFDENYMDALNAYNSLDNQIQYDGTTGDPIYLFSNSARGRTFVVSFEYKY